MTTENAKPDLEWRNALNQQLEHHAVRFRNSKCRWDFWYYTCMYGTIGLSALSALVLKLETISGAWQKDLAALFAVVSALLGAAMTTGNFRQRWRAARHADATVQQLRLDICNPDISLAKLNEDLKIVLAMYEIKVVGDDDE